MCDARLHEGEINRFNEIPGVEDSLVLRAFAQGDGQQQMLASLAVCSLAARTQGARATRLRRARLTYAAWWREHGARVGVLHCEPTPHIDWATDA